jgi:hypothetical protein
MDEASQLYAVLIEQQKYNPSQAVKVLVHFKYCSSDAAWQIAKLYHATKGKSVKTINKQHSKSNRVHREESKRNTRPFTLAEI